MSESPSIIFDSLKETYSVGDLVQSSFSIIGFVSSPKDWVGVFPCSSSSSCDKPLSYEYITTADIASADAAGSLVYSLKIDSPATSDFDPHEVRYITESNVTIGRTNSFKVSLSACETRGRDNAFKDDNLALISISKSLVEERKRRKIAENAVQILSRQLGEQMNFISLQGENVTKLHIGCEREKSVKEYLIEENKDQQEQSDVIANELDETRSALVAYKTECSRLRKIVESADEMNSCLRLHMLENREDVDGREDIVRIEKDAWIECKSMNNNIELLEGALEKERTTVRQLREELKSKREVYEIDIELHKKVNARYISDVDSLTEEINGAITCRNEAEKSYEKTISELESRVANESSNASRLENDLTIAELRCRESDEDVKFFRQQLLDTEEKLISSQNLLSKTLEEMNNLKNLYRSNAGNMVEIISENKSTSCDLYSVSTSRSTDLISINAQPRLTEIECGSITNKGCGTDLKASYHNTDFSSNYSINPAEKSKISSEINGCGNNNIKTMSEVGNGEDKGDLLHPISVVIDSRRVPKKGRRRYSKPIDLSLGCLNTVTENVLGEEQHLTFFSRELSELDRTQLESQYCAIRQHRNSLIRENTYLKNKVSSLVTDLVLLQKNLQDIIADAEQRISLLQVIINNQNLVMQGHKDFQFYPEVEVIDTQLDDNASTDAGSTNFLSPHAEEYTPVSSQCNNSLNIPPPDFFFDYVGNQVQNGYLLPFPPSLPATPIPHIDESMVDVTHQLANMGIPLVDF